VSLWPSLRLCNRTWNCKGLRSTRASEDVSPTARASIHFANVFSPLFLYELPQFLRYAKTPPNGRGLSSLANWCLEDCLRNPHSG
jgi:hypothetical protein